MAKLVKKSNLDRLKAEIERKKSGGGGGNYRFWKPMKYGKYVVRFLPPKDPDGLFYYETAQYKIGDSYYFAPISAGMQDPIYEMYKRLWDIGTDDAIALARELKPRKQYLYNIIVKEELGEAYSDPTKVQVYMSGKKLYETLLEYFIDDDYGDLTDVEEGFDFIIDKKEGDYGFPNYDNSRPRPKRSPLFDDDDMVEKVLKNLNDLEDEVEYKDYDELKKILNSFLKTQKSGAAKFIDSSDSDSDDDEEEEAPTKKSSTKKQEVEDSDDVDEEDMDDFEKSLLSQLDD